MSEQTTPHSLTLRAPALTLQPRTPPQRRLGGAACPGVRYPQSGTPKRITARRGERSWSTQTDRGTHVGERARRNPTHEVTGQPSNRPVSSPRRHAMNVTIRRMLRKRTSPCGYGPKPHPAFIRVRRDSSRVTRWPPLTDRMILFPLTFGAYTSIGLARRIASGPTTRLSRRVKSSRRPQPGLVEQSSTAPRGRSLL